MKKIYQSPATIVLQISQQLMQNASLTKDSSTIISNNKDVLSRRRGSSWDDDDYDE